MFLAVPAFSSFPFIFPSLGADGKRCDRGITDIVYLNDDDDDEFDAVLQVRISSPIHVYVNFFTFPLLYQE